MNAIKFIKENGVDVAREAIEEASAYGGDYLNGKTLELSKYAPSVNAVFIPDLKRLVESVDLVKRYGGIAEVKTLHQDEFWNERVFERLKQAIADYESIYSGVE